MSGVEIVGIAAAVCTGVSMLPQLTKVVKEKKAESVSIPMIIILMAGLSLWVVYGFYKTDYPIICTNLFSFMINACLIYFGIKYKTNSR